MHELPVTMSILSIVLEHASAAQASKVIKIDLVIGNLSGFVPECIQFQFDILKRGTIAAEAALCFQEAESKLHCRNCDTIYSPDDFNLRCPTCGEQEIEVISGRECHVESIEVE